MSGRVFLLGDGISTDAIMPGRYNVTTDPDGLRRACLIEARPDFVENCAARRRHRRGAQFRVRQLA